MNQHEQRESIIPTIDRFHEIEMEKLFDVIDASLNREQQMATLFATASVAVLSIGFSAQKAGLSFLAGIIILLFLGWESNQRHYLAAYYYRMLQLQARFAPHDDDFYLGILPSPLISWVRETAKLPQVALRIKALHHLPLRFQSVTGFWIPALVGLIDISVGAILCLVFRWPIF